MPGFLSVTDLFDTYNRPCKVTRGLRRLAGQIGHNVHLRRAQSPSSIGHCRAHLKFTQHYPSMLH